MHQGREQGELRHGPGLRELGDALTPSSSAIVALVEHTWVDEFKDALAVAGGNMMVSTLTADVAEQLAAGRDVAYSAIGGGGGLIAASRTTFEDVKDAAADTAQSVATTVDNAVDTAKIPLPIPPNRWRPPLITPSIALKTPLVMPQMPQAMRPRKPVM
ncbi:DUF1269 domain-containing protein [Candidatus Gracilibacteria bacterium]|nr:DUF1269 domain-containing protein [Candidatus Gracilibacteria bacterium]